MDDYVSRIRDDKNRKYEKVIFLDVDGVLNDESMESFNKKIYVEEVRVKRLRDIVEATQADIVMSSSWRHYFRLYNQCIGQSGPYQKPKINL